MQKRFVLDTNILLSDPHCITDGFEDNIVIITGTTLQELDSKKSLGGEVGYAARECTRILDRLRTQGDLSEGVPLPNGGQVRVVLSRHQLLQNHLPADYSLNNPDNRILNTCMSLQNRGEKVILVTNDGFMRINASVLGIDVEEYRNSIVEESGYSGHTDLDVSDSVIDAIYHDGEYPVDDAFPVFVANEFVTLHCGSQSALSVYRNGKLERIREKTLFGGVTPKNAMQTYAMWALTAPVEEIPLVILLGPAGTAKTFLSLAAGLDGTQERQKRNENRYNKILLSRPTADSYQEIGFLPGDLDDKLAPLLASYYDNMEVLLSGAHEDIEQVRLHMQDFLDSGVVEVCGLNFIRGRSLQNSYLICDEAQNASPTLIRDVITRAGQGTKVVITGDPSQIDVPTLDKRTCGIVWAAEGMMNSPLSAVIKFDAANSVRSPLAKDAIERLRI